MTLNLGDQCSFRNAPHWQGKIGNAQSQPHRAVFQRRRAEITAEVTWGLGFYPT